MNYKVCTATLKKHIAERAPKFYEFMHLRKIYRGLTDVIFIESKKGDEPCVVTSHTEGSPFDYYKWVLCNDYYIPKPISKLELNKIIKSITKRK